jgi:hypothetical protein
MSVDADTPQEGIGLWRGPGERWAGPPGERAPEGAFDGDGGNIAAQFVALRESLENLGRAIASATEEDPPTGVASGNTDASGNLWLPIYACAAGQQFRLHRAVVEAQGSSPTSPSSAGWYGFYASDSDIAPGGTFTNIGDVLQGSLKDFAPATAGGPTFPAVFTDNSMQAAEVRGPKHLILVVVGGPATKRITVNYQGSLRRARGIV